MNMASATRTQRFLGILVLSLGLSVSGISGLAEQCPPCRSKSHTKDIGSCKLCGEMTESGQFQLCMGCSSRLRECQWCRKPLSTEPAAKQLCVRMMVLSERRNKPIGEDWVRQELIKLNARASIGVQQDWKFLGEQPVTIHDSKHFGRLVLKVTRHDRGPLKVEIPDNHHVFLELNPIPGTRKVILHPMQSTVARMDLYLVFEVQEAVTTPPK